MWTGESGGRTQYSGPTTKSTVPTFCSVRGGEEVNFTDEEEDEPRDGALLPPPTARREYQSGVAFSALQRLHSHDRPSEDHLTQGFKYAWQRPQRRGPPPTASFDEDELVFEDDDDDNDDEDEEEEEEEEKE